MKRITFTIQLFAWFATLAFAAVVFTGCNETDTTDDGPTAAASPGASSQRPHTLTPEELARQTAEYADRLNERQQATSPYPPQNMSPTPAPPAKVQWLDPKSEPADAAPPPPTDATSSAPAAPGAPAKPAELSRDQLIHKLADDLKPRSAEQNAAIRPWLQRAALAVIDPSYELSADDLKTLSEEDRKLVMAWQRTFAQLGRSLSSDPKASRSALIDLVGELSAQIDEQQPLSIRTIKLCTRVNGYGVYDEIDKPVFLAGTEHPVIVYAELDHFQTKLDEQKRHTVQLSQELVLYNEADGLPVWRQRPVAINDVSANRRRDFFTVQIITLSDRLSVGKYILKLRVTDEIGSTVAESSLPVQIVADAKLVNEK